LGQGAVFTTLYFLANIRLGWKGLPVMESIKAEKSLATSVISFKISPLWNSTLVVSA